jgi:hypothetical protein
MESSDGSFGPRNRSTWKNALCVFGFYNLYGSNGCHRCVRVAESDSPSLPSCLLFVVCCVSSRGVKAAHRRRNYSKSEMYTVQGDTR